MNSFGRTLLISYSAVIITALISFISAPLLLNYFGKNLYGIFALTSDTLAYLGLFSFGIPWAASTIFAKLKTYRNQKIVIGKSMNILLAITILISVIILILNLLMPGWINFINQVPANIQYISKQFILISIIFFLIRLPFSMFPQLLIFLNQVAFMKLIDILSGVTTFIALVFVIKFKINILNYAIIIGVISLIMSSINIIIFYKLWLQPVNNRIIANKDAEEIGYKHILTSGLFFFINGIGGLLIWNTDNILVSHYLGLGKVAEYAILFKIFTMLFTSITQIMNILNPLYPKLYYGDQLKKLEKIFKLQNYVFPIIGGLIFIFMFGFLKEFIYLWLHKTNMFAGYSVAFILGLYFYFVCITGTYYSAIISLNYTKHIYKFVLLEAILNFGISIILIKYTGLVGVALGTLISHVTTMFILAPLKLQTVTNRFFNAEFMIVIKHFCITMLPLIIVLYYLNLHTEMAILPKLACLIIIVFTYLIMSYLMLPIEIMKNILSIKKIKIYVNS